MHGVSAGKMIFPVLDQRLIQL